MVRIEPDDFSPDCCFIEDTAVVLGEHALVTKPGHSTRRGEGEGVVSLLHEYLSLHHARKPATIDGGRACRWITGLCRIERTYQQRRRRCCCHRRIARHDGHARRCWFCPPFQIGLASVGRDDCLVAPTSLRQRRSRRVAGRSKSRGAILRRQTLFALPTAASWSRTATGILAEKSRTWFRDRGCRHCGVSQG